MAEQWASTEEHAPAASDGWASTDEHADPVFSATGTAKAPRSLKSSFLHIPDELLQGAGAGVVSTALGAYKLARKIPGVDKVLPAPGATFEAAAQAPDSIAGKAGKLGEQTAEFAFPLGSVAKSVKGLPVAARLAAEATAAGAITGVQTGGDPGAMAFTAGTVGALGGAAEAVPPLARMGAKAVLNRMNGVSPRPLSAAATALADELGIPLSTGARSGSKFTQAAEKILGSTVAPDLYEAHTAAGTAGISRGVRNLTGDFATDRYAAGEATLDALGQHSADNAAAAHQTYNKLAEFETDPANIVEVVQKTKLVKTPPSGMLDPQGRPMPGGVREVPVTENIGLPVDTRGVRAMLEPIQKSMMRQYPIARQQADAGLHAINNILNGPRYVPASVAETFLSAAKKIQREAIGPNKLLIGDAINGMSPAVDEAVARAGDGAVDILHQSRAAWREHIATDELMQELSGDVTGKTGQTAATEKLLRPADAAFPTLERVLARTPEAAEPMRLALLAKVFQKAEAGEFTNPTEAKNLFSHIGQRTKAALFTPEQLSDVDATLELAKRLSENPNPSGSGLINAMVKMGLLVTHPVAGGATLMLGRKFAKALYNPEGAAAMRAALTGGPAAPAALAALSNAIEAPAAAAAEAAAPEAAAASRFPRPYGSLFPEAKPAAVPEAAPGMLTATDEYGDTVSQPAAGVKIAPEYQHAPAPAAAAPAAATAPELDLFGNPVEPEPAAPAAPAAAAPDAPGSIRKMNPRDIVADPARFQFKRDTGGASGTGDELKGVKTYDPELGGVLSVWKDPADGKTYVVNGHHRLELATRANAPDVTVRYLDAENAAAARTKGALINIAEGRGTAIDAAKVFRDTGMSPADLEQKGISLKGATARNGANLAKLAPQIFEHVIQGDLPVERASIIGELLPEHADQTAALELMDRAEQRGKGISNDAFRELVEFVKGAPRKESDAGENLNLFGDAPAREESTALEMASLSDYIRKKLGGEKKLFGIMTDATKAKALEDAGNALASEKNASIAEGAAQHLAVYDKLKTSAGPINDTLRKAAESLGKKGAPANEIKAHAYERIRDAIRKTLGQGPG